jgi:hypothetical protein
MSKFKCKPQTIDDDGRLKTAAEEVTFSLRKPTADEQREASGVFNRTWAEAVKNGAMLRNMLEEFMDIQGLWGDGVRAKIAEIQKEVNHYEVRLEAGGFEFDEAVQMAVKLRQLREKLRKIVSKRTDLDSMTAEGQADNARFNYYVSVCLVYNDSQKRVFSSLEDYVNNSSTIQAAMGASRFAQMMYGLQENYEAHLTENKFLAEFGLLDSQNRLLNADGHLIDDDGKLINEDGYYVLADGTLCDVDGRPTEPEQAVVERKPFTRNGQPVVAKATTDNTISED